MNRRKYLIAAVAASASAIAGCSGSEESDSGSGSGGSTDEGGDSDDEPESGGSTDGDGDPVQIDAPAAVTAGETFDLTVTVRNTESDRMTFRKVVGVEDGPSGFSQRMQIGGIPPGETRSKTIEAVLVSRGEHVLGMPGIDASAAVTVEPRIVGVGEATSMQNGIDLTLEGVTIPFSVVTEQEVGGYTTRYDITAAAPPDGNEYVYATFRAAATGEEGARIRPEQFSAETGTLLDTRQWRIEGDGVPAERPIPLWRSRFISPGGERSFRVPLEVPQSELQNIVRVGYDPSDDGTPAETVFEATAEGERFPHPSFDLVSVDAPSLQAGDPQGILSYTVENTGEYPAEFVGTVNWQTQGGDWASDPNAGPDLHRAVVEPGETRMFELTWDGGDARTGTRTYRVRPFERTFEITFE
jgi:hypothetical protein